MNMKKKIVLKGATVIDGLGNDPKIKTIFIEDGVIRNITDYQQGNDSYITDGYENINLSGKYIMPGMIEMHGHFYAGRLGTSSTVLEQYTKLYLAGGVITVRSAAEKEPEKVFEYRDAINNGDKIGPRILTAGYYLNRLLEENKSKPAGWMPAQETLDDIIALYHKQRNKVDQIKVYNCMTPDWIKVVCDMAHSDGLRVYGHIGKSTAEAAIHAGIDGLDHGPFNMPEFYQSNGKFSFWRLTDFDPNSDKAKRLSELIIQKQVAITPTNVIIATDGKRVTKKIEDNKIYRYYAGDELDYQKKTRAASDANIDKVKVQDDFMSRSDEFIYNLYKNGAKIFCGTDPVDSVIMPGYGIVWEAEYLNKIGLSNDYIIKALTSEAAKQLGVSDITGSISVGKQADLVVLNKNPLEDISNLSTQELVYKSGIEYKTKEIRKSLKGCFNESYAKN